MGTGHRADVHVNTPNVYIEPVHVTPAHSTVYVGGSNNVNVGGEVGLGGDVPDVCGVPIPIVSPAHALIVLILNILWPGIGTMVLGCINPGASTCCCWFLIGLAQDFLGYICIGWIWGIITALKVMAMSAMWTEGMVYGSSTAGAAVELGGVGGSVSVKVN